MLVTCHWEKDLCFASKRVACEEKGADIQKLVAIGLVAMVL